jgi:tetratricopeptide (TPR) repeat protein
MAFEKAKVLKAAEKFLSQGKIEPAIKEYRQIVENDETDFTTLNMLGDLCVRAGKKDEAVSCFMRIAEHYRDQEFTLKAIAMFKKVERLKPRDPEIARNLGALYANQGLVVDARAQYLIVADAYTRFGQTKQALEVLRKIADLDPQNTDIRLKLAEGYLKENLHSEAAEAFKEAAGRLFEIGAFERSLEACGKALQLQPYDLQALKSSVSAHIAIGTADEAAELLEKTVAERRDDPDLIVMLAGAHLAAEDAGGAERATALLISLDASNYTRLIPVAQLYLKLGETNEAARVLEGIVEQMLAGREENDLLELVNEVLARNPEHVKALRMLSRIHWWQRDMDSLRGALERLAEAAQVSELIEDERYALTQLLRLSADEPRYSERLNELGGVQEEPPAEPVFPESVVSDVPTFETFAADPTPAVEQTAELDAFETNSVTEPTLSDPESSFADLNDGLMDAETPAEAESKPAVSGPVEFDFGDVQTPEPVGAVSTEDNPRHLAMMLQELESVDFYLNQGYFDIAADTLQMLEGQFGTHPEIDERRQRLDAASQANAAPPASPVVSFELAGPGTVVNEAPQEAVGFEFGEFASSEAETTPQANGDSASGTSKSAIDSGLAEVFEEFKVAAESEASSNEDFETHYNMGTAYKEMDLLDDAIQEFQAAASLSKPGDGTPRFLQCCNMLGHCFSRKSMPRAAVLWFKKGLEAPGHSEEEYLALRYELAGAYEQLGDIGRAIDVFTEVYGINISYREVAEKLKSLQQQRASGKSKKKKSGGKERVAG